MFRCQKMHDRSRWSTNGMIHCFKPTQPMKRPSAPVGFSHTPEWGAGQITARKNMRAAGKERHRISAFGILPVVPSPKRRAIFISDCPLFHSVEANGQKGGIPEDPAEGRALSNPHAHKLASKCDMWSCSLRTVHGGEQRHVHVTKGLAMRNFSYERDSLAQKCFWQPETYQSLEPTTDPRDFGPKLLAASKYRQC